MRHIIAKYFKPSAARILLGAVLTMSASTALAVNDGRTIHGKIVDADGKPVTGAIVNINEALRKTLTNADGNFTIKVKSGDDLYILPRLQGRACQGRHGGRRGERHLAGGQ